MRGGRCADQRPRRAHAGFTLIELMVALLVVAILISLSAPMMRDLVTRNRLKTAAQAFAEDLQWTRSEAIRRNQELFVTIDSATWCYGISLSNACDCRLTDPRDTTACALPTAGEAVLKTVSGQGFPGVRIAESTFGGAPAWTRFEPRRTTARVGSLTFAAGDRASLRVVVSLLGRVRICTPAGSVAGYPAC
ncbi:MAG: prepilin-type N-terminal cleavage/methylation domain-containing protein [Sphingobacteriia bacterium]|nr:prepilin-type N-terminal cleavage/methylation domain-containing protein [Sphingobacteriia bacterium]NCC38900.1 prepilin-type N-terminal cleavage/methylation domain-containing protein [Gammaproteobacteria bacterium]